MITYRKALVEDAQALAKIRMEFLRLHYLYVEEKRTEIETACKDFFKTAIGNNSFAAWIALDGENIVATSGVSFYVLPPSFRCVDGKTAYITNVFTLPQYRNLGIATELLKKVVAEAKGMGYNKVTLHSTAIARPIYEKYGFTEILGYMELRGDK